MKTFFRKTGVKISTGILCVLSFAVAAVSAFAIIVLLAAGGYEGGSLFTEVASAQVHDDASRIMHGYFDPNEPTKPWASYYDGGIYTGEDTNFLYNVVDDETGYSVLSTLAGGEKVCLREDMTYTFETTNHIPMEDQYTVVDQTFLCQGMLFSYDVNSDAFICVAESINVEGIPVYPDSILEEGFTYTAPDAVAVPETPETATQAVEVPVAVPSSYPPTTGQHYEFDGSSFYASDWDTEFVVQTKSYTIICYLLSGLPHNDEYRDLYTVCSLVQSHRYTFIVLLILSLVLSITSLSILCCTVGRKPGQDEAYMPLLFRLPADGVLVAAAFGVCACIVLISDVYYTSYISVKLVCGAVLTIAASAIVVYTILLLAARRKTRTLISGSVIGWCVLNAGQLLGRCGRFVARCLGYLPMLWKVAVCYVFLCVVEFFFLMVGNINGGVFALWVVEKFILGALVAYVALAFNRLKEGAEAIAEGEYDYFIETDHLVLDFKDTADTLNHIQDGMSAAVEDRMRSERLKTELITNVSHDLKTPLTSIVSYVDLLKQEPAGSEAAKEYLDVLDRQSQRLKKLITDLVDASKASTGNITVNKEALDITTLLGQALGEYRERLTEADIIPVIQLPEKAVMAEADGRLLWRVLDNLLGNVVKYAMPGTRFYVSLREDFGVRITFRNISRDPLEVSAEELTERFVRGDVSRHTEGSGLGLSIVKSLTEAMGGDFDLSVDGDLFKVNLYLEPDAEELPF